MMVLVVYASRHGATEGIATRIAADLADCGAVVDLRRVDDVETLDAVACVLPRLRRALRGPPRLAGDRRVGQAD